MKEIASNCHAWSRLSHEHYLHFKAKLMNGTHKFNRHIEAELEDLTGKRVIHLQCNTGADTLLLAARCAQVVGVDLVPENIQFAEQLAQDMGIKNAQFVVCDMMTLMDTHHEKYDMVFVSEGALGWLPDMVRWGHTIRHLLKDDGFCYVFDGHPAFLMYDETQLAQGATHIKYPYFGKTPDISTTIGGYAASPKDGVEAYFWMYTVADIICALAGAGLHIEYFHEFAENFYDAGDCPAVGDGLYNYEFNRGLFPMSFSLKATVYHNAPTTPI